MFYHLKNHLKIQNIKQEFIPGPSSTDNGFPVLRTGSPTVTPAKNSQGTDHKARTLYHTEWHCKSPCNTIYIPYDTK